MPKPAKELLVAALHAEPLTLAIFFIGMTCLGLIWLASIAIKKNKKP